MFSCKQICCVFSEHLFVRATLAYYFWITYLYILMVSTYMKLNLTSLCPKHYVKIKLNHIKYSNQYILNKELTFFI